MKRARHRRNRLSLLAAGLVFAGAAYPVMAKPESCYTKLHVEYDINEVEAVEEAFSYQAEWIQVEEETAKQALIHMPVVSEEPDAFGLAISAEDDGSEEVLRVLDGGEASGVRSGVKGGISYELLQENGKHVSGYAMQIVFGAEHPDDVEQLNAYNSRADYSQEKELGFAERMQTAAEMEELLERVGGVDLEVSRIYSLDQATLQEHMAEYQGGKTGLDQELLTEEEAYLVQFRQVVDGIPLADHSWASIRRADPTEMWAETIVSARGLVYAHMQNAVTIGQKLEKSQLISPQEAEDVCLSELRKEGFNYETYGKNYETYVENMELNYVGVWKGSQLELIPAWVFCIARETPRISGGTDEEDIVLKYDHVVINAETGKRIVKLRK